LENALDKLSNQARFVQMIVDKELVVSNRKKASIVAELRKKKFRPFPRAKKDIAEKEESEQEQNSDDGDDSDYDYLLGMAIGNLTTEKVGSFECNAVLDRY
jgi:DNA topoisomerase-2